MLSQLNVEERGKGMEMSGGQLRLDRKVALNPEGLVRHILQEIIITQAKSLITSSTQLGLPPQAMGPLVFPAHGRPLMSPSGTVSFLW